MTNTPNDRQREAAYECMARFGTLLAPGSQQSFLEFAARIVAVDPDADIEVLRQLPEARVERASDGSLALNFVPAKPSGTQIPNWLKDRRTGTRLYWWLAESLEPPRFETISRLIAVLPVDATVYFADARRVYWCSREEIALPLRLMASWRLTQVTAKDVPIAQEHGVSPQSI